VLLHNLLCCNREYISQVGQKQKRLKNAQICYMKIKTKYRCNCNILKKDFVFCVLLIYWKPGLYVISLRYSFANFFLSSWQVVGCNLRIRPVRTNPGRKVTMVNKYLKMAPNTCGSLELASSHLLELRILR
jgi:hypothetical protein